ncbi:hypothetical protein [Parasitella parasitica]|uniref:Uncharacterized protein n=1 Tax=Parasitella parasitica TaxID=35722 RepID=A0A0B7N9P0_9FUNG|nr:hypothetical protein [Parasitella parasitica]
MHDYANKIERRLALVQAHPSAKYISRSHRPTIVGFQNDCEKLTDQFMNHPKLPKLMALFLPGNLNTAAGRILLYNFVHKEEAGAPLLLGRLQTRVTSSRAKKPSSTTVVIMLAQTQEPNTAMFLKFDDLDLLSADQQEKAECHPFRCISVNIQCMDVVVVSATISGITRLYHRYNSKAQSFSHLQKVEEKRANLGLEQHRISHEILEYSRDDLSRVSCPLIDRQRRPLYRLRSVVDQTFKIFIALIEKDHNATKAKAYKEQVKAQCQETEGLLEASSTIIKVIDKNAFLLSLDNMDRLTECDFITQVWASLLKSYVYINGVLRMKTEESSSVQGIDGRKRSYSEAQARLSASKLCDDAYKLMCEAKDNLDPMLQHILKRHMEVPLLSYFIHPNDASANVGNLHLVKSVLHVALHKSKIHFSRNLASLEAFKNDFIMLVLMLFDLECSALMIKKSSQNSRLEIITQQRLTEILKQ